MISIVIPTYNEKDSLPGLLEKIFATLNRASLEAEVVIVDDNSPDGTAEAASSLGELYPVRVLRRAGKLGLSSAVIDGFSAASGDILGVMDADLSHDPGIIPAMIGAIADEGVEFVVGSRHAPGGGISNWPLKRRIVSSVAIMMGSPLTKIRDVTSGFFFLKRSVIDDVVLNPIGFKICLEIAVKGRFTRFREVPYVFTDRAGGDSKFNKREILNYLKQLADLYLYRLSGRGGGKRPA
jgi:dolichol-phosphate mannosyltransferase